MTLSQIKFIEELFITHDLLITRPVNCPMNVPFDPGTNEKVVLPDEKNTI